MRRNVTRTLLAAAAAGVTVTTLSFSAGAAGAASTANAPQAGSTIVNSPSGGTPIYTDANCPLLNIGGPDANAPALSDAPAAPQPSCITSGYQASGRDFRFAQALIVVPTSRGLISTSPSFYVGLSASATEYARAGIVPCGVNIVTCPNGWRGLFQVEEPGAPPITQIMNFSAAVPAGSGVLVSIYFNQAGNAVRFSVTLPDGSIVGKTFGVHGPVYTSAVAAADWTLTRTRPQPARPVANTRWTQFLQGRFTTLSGQAGTFAGPWTLNPVEVSSNGLAPPDGTLISAPSYLWTDGNSVNGLPGDAFGVWLYN